MDSFKETEIKIMTDKVIVDSRETKKRKKRAEKLWGLENVSIMQLTYGDYVYKNVGIELKTVEDFIGSIKSKRLYNQSVGLNETYAHHYVIVYGDVSKTLNHLYRIGHKFTVKQYPASYCQLIINETSREVPRDAATYKIDYSLTHSLDGYGFRFRTEHDVNWLTADYKDGIVTFTVTENTASDSRTCRLQVHYEAAQSPVWITITQLGKSGIAGPIIETSIGENDYVVLEPTGEENYLFICYVKNPIPGVDLVAKADVDWIKNIKKYNDYYYSFDALPNNTEDTREGHIDLTYSTVHKRLTFIQVPND